jgi:hypothetical protein
MCSMWGTVLVDRQHWLQGQPVHQAACAHGEHAGAKQQLHQPT